MVKISKIFTGMVIITGAQRSGTTFLSKCFLSKGYDLKSSLYHGDIDGGYESDLFVYWASSKIKGFPFKEARDIAEYSTFGEVNKISYLTMVPSLLCSFIEEFNIKATWIFLDRNEQDIVNSKKSSTRFDSDHLLLQQTVSELRCNKQKSLDLLSYYGQKVVKIPFDSIRHSGGVIKEYTGIDISDEITHLFDPKKIKSWEKP